MTAAAVTVPGTIREPTRRFCAGLIAGGIAMGLAGGYLASSGHATRVVALFAVLLPVALWKRPWIGPAVLLSAAILVEQSGIDYIPITGRIPMFQAIGPGHLQGSDILILMILGVYFLKRDKTSPRWRPRSHITLAIVMLLGAVAWGVLAGQAHHGSLRQAFMEARPYVYLAASYFLTSVLVSDRRALRSVLWAFVISVGIKAAQGVYVYFKIRHMSPRPETVIGHEASYFFVAYFVLVMGLWLFADSGRLRAVATRMLPIVVFCDFVNNRRAAWELLGGALLTFVVIAYQTAPMRRKLLGQTLIGVLLLSAVYFPVMWNRTDSLAQPARAIRSQIKPSARDASSDVYRVQENANLQYNIRQNPIVPKGFGTKIDYALPITDISSIDALIAYIPHDDVLYQLMRMGAPGSIAMWFLLGSGIITGCRLARSKDRSVAVIGITVASALVAYALLGAVDQGFFWYRVAFVTGTLLGLAEAARHLQRTQVVLGGPTRSAVPALILGLKSVRRGELRRLHFGAHSGSGQSYIEPIVD